MFTMVFFFTLLMFIYSNTMYYTFMLLLVVFSLLFHLVSLGIMQVLTSLMLLIVYVGAMMILIGYICAVSPNLVTVSSVESKFFFFLVFLVLSFSLLSSEVSFFVGAGLRLSPLIYFYTDYGIFIFLIIVISLFVTLLMVTTQYLTPNGPFRSLS